MMRRPVRFVSLALITACAQGSIATADPIRVEFGGVLTFTNSQSGVATGTRFSGSVVYNPSQPTLTASDDANRHYLLGPGSQISVDINDKTVYSSGAGLELWINQAPGSVHDSSTPPYETVFPPHTSLFFLQNLGYLQNVDLIGDAAAVEFRNDERMVLPILGVPNTLNAADYPQGSLVLARNHGGETLYAGVIDSIQVVPEPAGLWLILIGFIYRILFLHRRTGARAV